MIKSYMEENSLPPKGKAGTTPRIKDIQEFIKSGKEACEICVDEGKKASSVAATYAGIISRHAEFSCVRAASRSGRVFLIRKTNNIM